MEFHHAGENYTAMAVLGLTAYPDATLSGILDDLMNLSHPFTVLQHVHEVDPEVAKDKLEKKIYLNKDSGRFKGMLVEDQYEEGEKIEAQKVKYASQNYLIYVYGDDKRHLEEGVRTISAKFIEKGYQTIREKTNLYASYLAQFPDYVRQHKIRAEYLSVENISDMTLLSGKPSGFKKCVWGNAPVATFRTDTDGIYDFIFQNNEKELLGHTMVIAPTGGGKTVLMEWLIAGCLKYTNFHALCFDSKQGLRVFTEALGGSFSVTSENKTLAMNPLQLPDTDDNRNFIAHWIKMMANGLNDSELEQVNQMIEANFFVRPNRRTLENAVRTFSSTVDHLSNTEQDRSLKARIAKWSDKTDTMYGHYFTSERDNLFYDENPPQIATYDMAGLLNREELLMPIASYIFHSFRTVCEGKSAPHVCFIDEMSKYLKSKHFSAYIEESIRESRKLNGVLVGALQSPADLTDQDKNPIGPLILKNIATLFIFPDPQAKKDEYCGDGGKNPGLGLTEAEFDWVRSSAGLKWHVLVKKKMTGESAILNLDLSSLGNDLKLLSSDQASVKHMLAMKEKHGDQWRPYYTGDQ